MTEDQSEIKSPPQSFLKCPRCNGVLGVEIAGLHVVHHAGRAIVGKLLSQRCKCGGLWESAEMAALKRLLDVAGPTPSAVAMRGVLADEAA